MSSPSSQLSLSPSSETAAIDGSDDSGLEPVIIGDVEDKVEAEDDARNVEALPADQDPAPEPETAQAHPESPGPDLSSSSNADNAEYQAKLAACVKRCEGAGASKCDKRCVRKVGDAPAASVQPLPPAAPPAASVPSSADGLGSSAEREEQHQLGESGKVQPEPSSEPGSDSDTAADGDAAAPLSEYEGKMAKCIKKCEAAGVSKCDQKCKRKFGSAEKAEAVQKSGEEEEQPHHRNEAAPERAPTQPQRFEAEGAGDGAGVDAYADAVAMSATLDGSVADGATSPGGDGAEDGADGATDDGPIGELEQAGDSNGINGSNGNNPPSREHQAVDTNDLGGGDGDGGLGGGDGDGGGGGGDGGDGGGGDGNGDGGDGGGGDGDGGNGDGGNGGGGDSLDTLTASAQTMRPASDGVAVDAEPEPAFGSFDESPSETSYTLYMLVAIAVVGGGVAFKRRSGRDDRRTRLLQRRGKYRN